MNQQKSKILFVDDEPMILNGLKRMLRNMRHTWSMEFLNSAQEALSHMEEEKVDVLVSDMRMPDISGIELQNIVKEKFPETMRIILSGQTSDEQVLKSINSTHQFYTKPCNADYIVSMIEKALKHKGNINHYQVQKIISGMNTIPSLSDTYQRIQKEFQSKEPSIEKISQCIEMDAALASKILQLVNSSFYGIGNKVVEVNQATRLIGLDTLKMIILSADILTFINSQSSSYEQLKRELKHSHKIAISSKHILAQIIAEAIRSHRDLPGNIQTQLLNAYTCGLLHDIGSILFWVNFPQEYKAIYEQFKNNALELSSAEKEQFDCTHEDIASYLLGLWGLPNSIINRIKYHHNPMEYQDGYDYCLLSVHLADQFDTEHYPHINLNTEFIQLSNLELNIDELKESTKKLFKALP